MTKLRITGGLLCVLYIAVACCFGLSHDHHDQGAYEHCAACAWAVNTITDVAVPVIVPVVTQVVVYVTAAPSLPIIVAPVFCNTASRAPPLASA